MIELLVLTDRHQTGGRPLAEVVAGAPALVVREKDLPEADRRRLIDELRPLVGLLLVASGPQLGTDGVHLAAHDPFPAPRPGLVGRSCHSRHELEAAAAEGCDYATLSPIFPSASKPGYGPPLGTGSLGDAPLPVYALGGVDRGNARSCIAAGATGVAVMGAVMEAADPQRLMRELVRR